MESSDDALSGVDTVISKLMELPTNSVCDHALCYLITQRAELLKLACNPTIHDSFATGDSLLSPEERLQLLVSLPDSIRTRPAVIASVSLMHQQLGNEEKAQRTMKEAGDDQGLANFYMSQGRYEEAAAIYESACEKNPNDSVACAQLVQALSYTDAKRSRDIWERLCSKTGLDPNANQDEEPEVNAADLETRESPRLKSSRKPVILPPGIPTNEKANAVDKGKKSHEAVLRQRARKREVYLTKLEEKGLYRRDRPSKPDPERWLPKYERSYARRRRNRGATSQQHKGAQGGVSEKDAAKLDVAARQASRASGESGPLTSGRSTAHMTVSTSGAIGRKAGRRK